jgi:hypothetical protein
MCETKRTVEAFGCGHAFGAERQGRLGERALQKPVVERKAEIISKICLQSSTPLMNRSTHLINPFRESDRPPTAAYK